ncbi:hypothetical protein [Aeoliella sp. SH292]|uniref:hypothetical protein n=1 Tax=Aeoliella sp. SH292 TaxID=3454464 RepID=UPI003F962F66
MSVAKVSVLGIAGLSLVALLAAVKSCNGPVGPPTGSYKIDTVTFKPTNPQAAAGPAPGVWIDTNLEVSSLTGGTVKSELPYQLAFDYTDNEGSFQNIEFTSVMITYDDGTIEPATSKLKLPLRIAARLYETVNSVSGGRVVKGTVSILSSKIPGVITRDQPFTLEMEGHFTKPDGSKVPFAIKQHFDVEVEKSTKSAAEVLQDK